jgi:hypothetical protein
VLFNQFREKLQIQMARLYRAPASREPDLLPSPLHGPARAGPTAVLLGDQGAESHPWSKLSVPRLLVILLLVTFILRIFYAGHLYEDDGLWFTAAEQILRGKALYREIYFDKPPLLPLTYALLFKYFGAHILTIRLFTIVYATAITGLLYWIGSKMYGQRAGMLSAFLFAFFSTTYGVGHVQALNTDFLMVAPYALAAFAFIRSDSARFRPGGLLKPALWYAFAGGLLTGVATQTNPKGIFDIFFFVFLLTRSTLYQRRRTDEALPYPRLVGRWEDAGMMSGVLLLATSVAGVLAGCLPFLIFIARSHSLADYWTYVWQWGFRYSNYYPLAKVIKHGLWVTAGYLALNNTLAIALLFVIVGTIRRRARADRLGLRDRMDQHDRPTSRGFLQQAGAGHENRGETDRAFEADASLLLWLAASFIGLSVGGRFFAHYFFQILPCLCLLGGRGLIRIATSLTESARSPHRRLWVRVMAGLLVAGFAVTAVRYHTRTFWLASDWIRGIKSEATTTWYHETRNRDERRAAAIVRDVPDGADAADQMGLEAIRAESLGKGSPSDSSGFLFVWGYRPWIYYWSGLIPASKYLSAQPLTGVPAGSEYGSNEVRPILGPGETAAARAELLKELDQTKPQYVIDDWEAYNPALGINAYPEMRAFMSNYKAVGASGNLRIYRRRQQRNRRNISADESHGTPKG